MSDKVKVLVTYVLRGSVIMEMERERFEILDADPDGDDGQMLLDELSGSGRLEEGILEGELEDVSLHKPRAIKFTPPAQEEEG